MRTREVERSQVVEERGRGAPGLVVVASPHESLVHRFFPLAPRLMLSRRDGELGDLPGRLAILDAGISREHAELQWRSDGTGCEVRDRNSKNGTFVERRRVTCELAPMGSLVRAGDTILEVTMAPPDAAPDQRIVGRSFRLARLLAEVRRAAAGDGHVLIEGETGTGKELVADALHRLGGRLGRLVAINCASIPGEIAESFLFGHRKGAFTGASQDADGVFEQARDGTLFLDEIGELRLDLQAKLLRVLETRQFSPLGTGATRDATARILSATNAKLRLQVAAGTFRADLFARLAGVELEVPPLRHRRSDIPLIAAHFLAAAVPGARFTFSANAMAALLLHGWPLNVRELRTLCGRLASYHPEGGVVRSADLAAVLPGAGEAEEPSSQPEATHPSLPSRDELADRMRDHHGNVVKLAGHYGKDRRQIYRWLEAHRLDPQDFR